MISVCSFNRLVFLMEVVFSVRCELNVCVQCQRGRPKTDTATYLVMEVLDTKEDRPPDRPCVRRTVTLTWYPRVALGQVCLQVLRCYPVIIQPMPHTYSLIFEASCKRTDGRSVGPFPLNMMLVQKSRVSRRKNMLFLVFSG